MHGGCFCGKIRFSTAKNPNLVVNCHCDNCKRSVGAPFVTWAVFEKESIIFNESPLTHTASNRAIRTFCATCGTSITYWHPNRKNELDITVGCLDEPEKYPPGKNIWTKKRLCWIENPDDIPDYSIYP
jgi:hypothetical protein